MPSGTGYADVVYIPRRGSDKPALIVELKFGGCTEGAIDQIKDRKYPTIVLEFIGNILLVGINYHKMSKKHECHIEKWKKTQVVVKKTRVVNEKSQGVKKYLKIAPIELE